MAAGISVHSATRALAWCSLGIPVYPKGVQATRHLPHHLSLSWYVHKGNWHVARFELDLLIAVKRILKATAYKD